MKRVLVIEDDSEIRQCLVETLELEGYSVSAAADGREGLQKARDEAPNLITLDLRIPVLSGWQFMTIRMHDPELADIPVIVISGELQSGYYYHCGDVAARFLKPCDIDALLVAVARYATAETMGRPVTRTRLNGAMSASTSGAPFIG
jgi:CheY-like chemotaxis protein